MFSPPWPAAAGQSHCPWGFAWVGPGPGTHANNIVNVDTNSSSRITDTNTDTKNIPGRNLCNGPDTNPTQNQDFFGSFVSHQPHPGPGPHTGANVDAYTNAGTGVV